MKKAIKCFILIVFCIFSAACSSENETKNETNNDINYSEAVYHGLVDIQHYEKKDNNIYELITEDDYSIVTKKTINTIDIDNEILKIESIDTNKNSGNITDRFIKTYYYNTSMAYFESYEGNDDLYWKIDFNLKDQSYDCSGYSYVCNNLIDDYLEIANSLENIIEIYEGTIGYTREYWK